MKPGYSFLELVVVLMVMAVLISFVGPKFFKLLTDTERASTKNTLKVVKQAISQYRGGTHQYPKTLQDLAVKPEGITGWDGPYVGDDNSATPEVPKDAWNQDLQYKLLERGAKPPFELYSQGNPDKEDDRIDA